MCSTLFDASFWHGLSNDDAKLSYLRFCRQSKTSTPMNLSFFAWKPISSSHENESAFCLISTTSPRRNNHKTFTLTQSAILQHKLPNVQISHTMAFDHFPHYAKVNQWECCQNMNGNPRWFSISTRPLIRGSGNLTRGAVALKSVPSWDDQGGGSRSHKPSMRNSSKRQLKPSCAIKH